MHAQSGHDESWMRRALELAALALYRTDPNPRVGCVIVRDGQVLGEGATQPPGGPHAEVMALRDAQARGHDVAGATVYVTLEPCSHYGRTPPCAQALIAAAPARVVAAMRDPNPRVGGQGFAQLEAAGIAVTRGVCVDEALALNIGFVARMVRGTPWVWMKSAASLDGRTALPDGQSQWITSAQARDDGHHWRARASVVLTGIGTVRHDDPAMTARAVQTPRQPRRAVIDPRLEISLDAKLLEGGGAWVFTASTDAARRAALEQRGAEVIVLPEVQTNWRVSMQDVLQWMGQHEVNEVHLEAGSGLNGAFLAADAVDELLIYLAPMLLGEGYSMARLPVLPALADARRYDFFDMAACGPDVRLRARLSERWQALRAQVTSA